MSQKLLDFLRATENYKSRNIVIRVSDRQSKDSDNLGVVLRKRELSSRFSDEVQNAGTSPRIEICRQTKGGELEPIVGYREVKLGEDTGIFLD